MLRTLCAFDPPPNRGGFLPSMSELDHQALPSEWAFRLGSRLFWMTSGVASHRKRKRPHRAVPSHRPLCSQSQSKLHLLRPPWPSLLGHFFRMSVSQAQVNTCLSGAKLDIFAKFACEALGKALRCMQGVQDAMISSLGSLRILKGMYCMPPRTPTEAEGWFLSARIVVRPRRALESASWVSRVRSFQRNMARTTGPEP